MSCDVAMNRRVLCVDDEENILRAFERNLRLDCDLDTAVGSAAGLSAIERRGPYAVVISDLRMPEMDGIQFLSAVRKRSPGTVRLILSGNADLDAAIASVNEGHVFQFLTKPCSVDKLRAAIAGALQQYHGAAGGLDISAQAPDAGQMETPDAGQMETPDNGRTETLGAASRMPGALSDPPAARLLIVDDDASNRSALARRLTQRGYIVEGAADGIEALARIERGRYDLVMLDQMMPGMSGLDVLRQLRRTYSQNELPVIMVTGLDEGRMVAEALQLGANDYVVKPVEALVVAARIQSQLARSEADRAMKASDPLTGLGSRQLLLDRFTGAANRSGRVELRAFSVILIDLDDFSAINDSFGCEAGNQILREVAGRLKTSMEGSGVSGENYTMARTGGGEFVVLVDNLSAPATENLTERLLRSLRPRVNFGGLRHEIHAGAGIVMDDRRERLIEDVILDARLAASQSRSLGKNRWRRFDAQMRERIQARMSIAIDLSHAIERAELVAVYQPEIDLATREVIGFECLLRWQRAGGACVLPSSFIETAEQTDLIIPIGAWVVEQACRQLKIWQARFPRPRPLTMNVNLSVRQLADPDLIRCVRRSLAETGIPPATLSFELTESALVTRIDEARKTLAALRSLGVGLKLDDFGTGYSSLSYLSTFQFDSLKIDRSFVSKVASDTETNAIVTMIVKLAHALGMKVVAEGIEDERQLAESLNLGCDTAQGFYFSPALRSDDAERFLSGSGIPAV